MSSRERRKTRQAVRKIKSKAGSNDLADRIAAAMIEGLTFADENVEQVRQEDAQKDVDLVKTLDGRNAQSGKTP